MNNMIHDLSTFTQVVTNAMHFHCQLSSIWGLADLQALSFTGPTQVLVLAVIIGIKILIHRSS